MYRFTRERSLVRNQPCPVEEPCSCGGFSLSATGWELLRAGQNRRGWPLVPNQRPQRAPLAGRAPRRSGASRGGTRGASGARRYGRVAASRQAQGARSRTSRTRRRGAASAVSRRGSGGAPRFDHPHSCTADEGRSLTRAPRPNTALWVRRSGFRVTAIAENADVGGPTGGLEPMRGGRCCPGSRALDSTPRFGLREGTVRAPACGAGGA